MQANDEDGSERPDNPDGQREAVASAIQDTLLKLTDGFIRRCAAIGADHITVLMGVTGDSKTYSVVQGYGNVYAQVGLARAFLRERESYISDDG